MNEAAVEVVSCCDSIVSNFGLLERSTRYAPSGSRLEAAFQTIEYVPPTETLAGAKAIAVLSGTAQARVVNDATPDEALPHALLATTRQ